jgi:hypothetical protein
MKVKLVCLLLQFDLKGRTQQLSKNATVYYLAG